MRTRLFPLMVAVAALAWTACVEDPGAPGSSDLTGPSFAKGGAQCDTKAAPVRDYFDKETRSVVDALFRDLATGCANYNEGDLAVTSGFAILEEVEKARNAQTAGDPAAGAQVVAVAWNVMQPWVCGGDTTCVAPPIDSADLPDVTASLDLQGAFGVRSVGSSPVISYGNDDPDVLIPVPYWGIEPFTFGLEWNAVIPGGRALIMGYPDFELYGQVNELPLGPEVAYDWSVMPWYALTDGVEPLSVTVCAEATAGNKEKVAHGGAFLEDGRDSWCDAFNSALDDPLLAATGFASGLMRLAQSVIPFWPADLHATALGKSGSGKATEFSPYFGYQLYPEGKVTFITTPGSATAFDPAAGGDPSGSNLICEDGHPAADGAFVCPANHGIRVHLTTSNDSPLSGQETVFLYVTAEDNNGSWAMYGTFEGQRVDDPGPDYGLVYEWNDLALDKPGAYKLHTYRTGIDECVYLDDGSPLLDADGDPVCGFNTVGIAFPPATSVKFIVNP